MTDDDTYCVYTFHPPTCARQTRPKFHGFSVIKRQFHKKVWKLRAHHDNRWPWCIFNQYAINVKKIPRIVLVSIMFSRDVVPLTFLFIIVLMYSFCLTFFHSYLDILKSKWRVLLIAGCSRSAQPNQFFIFREPVIPTNPSTARFSQAHMHC